MTIEDRLRATTEAVTEAMAAAENPIGGEDDEEDERVH